MDWEEIEDIFDVEYDDDYFGEPTILDILEDGTNKIVEYMKSSAKFIFKQELEEKEILKCTNNELYSVNSRLQEENRKLKESAKSARFDELMKDRLMVMWKPSNVNKGKQPKCNKCDENRQIKFTSPTGKELSEWCDCSKNIYKYEPRQVIASEFNLRSNYGNGELIVWYKSYTDTDEGMSFDGSGAACDVISDGKDFEELDKTYEIFFTTEEECQRFCDWKNDK